MVLPSRVMVFDKFIRVSHWFLSFHSAVNDPATVKSKLRSEMRLLLETCSGELISNVSNKICQNIAHSEDLLQNSKTIAVYAASGAEISLSSLHQLLPSVRIVYPLCHPQFKLSYHHVSRTDELVPGMLDIPEPLPALHEHVHLAEIDLILCPGLAFGLDGSRLGRGGGYYDRALENFTGKTCGIAMTRQIKSSVPHDHHDAVMNYLASETGVQATIPH